MWLSTMDYQTINQTGGLKFRVYFQLTDLNN